MLLLTLSVIIAAAAFVFDSLESSQIRLLLDGARQQKTGHLEKIIELSGEKLRSLVTDYSFWDDMVSFVETADPTWAEENLEVSLDTYSVTAIWVMDPGFREVYSVATDGEIEPAQVSLAHLQGELDQLRFCHEYQRIGGRIVEIRGATIHRTEDIKRTKESFGYLLAGKVWDEQHLARLADASASTLRLLRTSALPQKDSRSAASPTLELHLPLKDSNGRVVAVLNAWSGNFPEILRTNLRRSIVMICASCALLILVMAFFLLRWVNDPLRAISTSLRAESAEPLGTLLLEPGEFGNVSRLVQAFFQQKRNLEQEVKARRELQRELAAARDQAMESVRSKLRLLATMSHEVRNPLSGILGMASHLLESPLGTEQRETAQSIRGSCSSLLEIVNDVLDYSKIESGHFHPESIELDLRLLVEEEVADVFAVRAQEKGVQLVALLPPDFPSVLRGDPLRVRQILSNLLSNAIKFTEHGDVLVKVRVGEHSDKLCVVRIEVSDTGIGIPKEDQDRIFEDYHQGDQSISRRFGGTGLGLSISKRIVELMNGRIGFESEAGKGTTFWVDLPFVSVAPTTDLTHGACERRTILIVQRHAPSRTSWRWLLEEMGHDVVEAVDANGVKEKLLRGELNGVKAAVVEEAGLEDLSALLETDENASKIRIIPVYQRFGRIRPVPAGDNPLYVPVRRAALAHALQKKTQGGGGTVADTPPLHRPCSGVRVLLAEDEPVNQKVLQRMLEKLGCTARVAASGVEVLELLKRGRFDLILMDCRLPQVDGLEATRRIRAGEIPGASDIPIIALTGNSEEENAQECMAAGMNDVQLKPIRSEVLSRLLERFGRVPVPRS